MRSIWNRRPTQSPVAVGQFYPDGDGFKLYRDGAYYQQPNSLLTPAVGVPALQLDFGFGASVTLAFGGFYAAADPDYEP